MEASVVELQGLLFIKILAVLHFFPPSGNFTNHSCPGLLPSSGWFCSMISAAIWKKKYCQRSWANPGMNPKTFISQVAVFGECCHAPLKSIAVLGNECQCACTSCF
uniref:Uncharacterized protein n=1 Tax=Melopsittacus undulatus TaxID=13146 RepID=A0A8V5GF34_MELUD